MKKTVKNVCVLAGTLAVIAMSIWGPEALARYRDAGVLNEIHAQTVEGEQEGYRYSLSRNEKLYLLSQCLNSQTLPRSEQNSLLFDEAEEGVLQNVGGSYAFVINHQGPSGKEITEEKIYEACNEGLAALKEAGILPDSVKAVKAADYEAELYSAIDVLEPRNNVSVWQMSLSESRQNADKSNRLMDAYIDADSGKLYEFYVRTPLSWDQIDPDAIIESWRNYLGLEAPQEYANDNPLSEATPYYKKYVFDGMDDGYTVVTVGFYEGISELFLKISK